MSSHPIAFWTKHWALGQGLKIQYEVETGSTNSLAKNDTSAATKPVLENGSMSEPTLYLAEKQTAGRGRGKNTWTTTDGALLSTWSFALAFPPQPILSPLVGLALFQAASTSFPGVLFNLKAPNDLYIGERKLAGLLIETVVVGNEITCAIGLGLNADRAPAGFEAQATGLSEHFSGQLNEAAWLRFLNLWKENLMHAVKDSKSESLRMDVRTRLVNALNLHPLLKEPVLIVDEAGQIITPSRTIKWHEL
jgi:BirA family transcriptional regulator, biotin operon repressor / biotin---[acetyl-CoA-carboxylase] ligase